MKLRIKNMEQKDDEAKCEYVSMDLNSVIKFKIEKAPIDFTNNSKFIFDLGGSAPIGQKFGLNKISLYPYFQPGLKNAYSISPNHIGDWCGKLLDFTMVIYDGDVQKWISKNIILQAPMYSNEVSYTCSKLFKIIYKKGFWLTMGPRLIVENVKPLKLPILPVVIKFGYQSGYDSFITMKKMDISQYKSTLFYDKPLKLGKLLYLKVIFKRKDWNQYCKDLLFEIE